MKRLVKNKNDGKKKYLIFAKRWGYMELIGSSKYN